MTHPQVSFTSMDEATPEEIDSVMAQAVHYLDGGLLDRIVGLLEEQRGPTLGYQVDRYEHALQTATRAYRDEAGIDLVVAALLHDVGDGLAPGNHAQLAAAIIEPYLSEEATWVVRHHGVFQGYHYWHKLGGNREAREQYRGHPYFVTAARFADDWDQRSFDAGYDSLALEAFMPLLREVFGREAGLMRFGEALPAPAEPVD